MKCVRMQIEPHLSSDRSRSNYVWCETCKVKVDCFSKHKRERPPEPCFRHFINFGPFESKPFDGRFGITKSCLTCDVSVKCFVKHREEVKYDRMQFD